MSEEQTLHPDDIEASERILDPRADPGAVAFGASGPDGNVEMRWIRGLRGRVQGRVSVSSRYPWWVLVSLLAGLLALNITFTVFVVALPTVARQLHTTISVLTWTSTGPLLTFGLAAPLLGVMGDRFGHRRLYLLGMAGAIVCAVLTFSAPDATVLLAARVLDGVEAAATGTASMALLMEAFEPHARVKALGWWSLVGAGGPVIGVSVGAPIIAHFGWRALFVGQFALLVACTLFVVIVLPKTRTQGRARVDRPGIDWIGSSTLSIAIGGAMLALNLLPGSGIGGTGVDVSIVVSVLALVLFIHRELTAAHPIIPLALWKRRNFTMPMAVRAFSAFAYFGGFFLFPLFMEQVQHFSITGAGEVTVARPLVFALSSPIAGYLAIRVGERNTTIFGAAAILASMVVFALLSTGAPLVLIVIALGLSGLGMGVATPATSATIANEVDVSELGMMSASQLLATQVGEVAGIQVMETIQASRAHRLGAHLHQSSALLGTFRDAFEVGALCALVAVVVSFGVRRMDRRPAGAPG